MPDDQKRRDITDQIDRNLRSAYARVLDEEMPEQFEVLLERLRRSRRAAAKRETED